MKLHSIMCDIICCFFTERRQILIYERKKSAHFADFFVWYSRRESRLWRRAPMNSGCPLFSLPVYGRYQLAFLANRSLPLASPPSIPVVLFCAYANKKSPCILRTFFVWYSRRESNPQRPLRRGLLYPFNYGSILSFNISAIPALAGICRFPQAESGAQRLTRTYNGP